jgi:hypothetical protein
MNFSPIKLPNPIQKNIQPDSKLFTVAMKEEKDKCKDSIKAYKDYINSDAYQTGKILNQQDLLILNNAIANGYAPLTREQKLVLRQNQQYTTEMLQKEQSLLNDIFNNCRNKDGALVLTDKEILEYSDKKKRIEDSLKFVNHFYEDPIGFLKSLQSYRQPGFVGKRSAELATVAIITGISGAMGWTLSRAKDVYDGFSFFFKGLNFNEKLSN